MSRRGARLSPRRSGTKLCLRLRLDNRQVPAAAQSPLQDICSRLYYSYSIGFPSASRGVILFIIVLLIRLV